MNAPARPPLMSLDAAIARLAEAARAAALREHERISTFEGLGRMLAEDVHSTLDVPPADNSEMDGYALRAADVQREGAVLRVTQRIPAGSVGTPLEEGTAARIFTGAQLPP